MSPAPAHALLWQEIADAANARPDFAVLTFEHQGQVTSRSYRQLWDNACRLAQALQDLGLQRGEHFALLMANHPEFVEAMLAASLTGSVFVPIDPRSHGERLAFLLAHAPCRGVIASDAHLAQLQDIRSACPHLHWILALHSGEVAHQEDDWRGVRSLQQTLRDTPLHKDWPARAATDAQAPWQILFTSGTTGAPKGIVMHQQRYLDNARATRLLCGYQEDDRPYTGLSLTHANAQVLTLGSCLVQGMPGVISRRFSKSRLWAITRRFGCTTFNLLGGMSTALYAEPEQADDSDHPVRFVLSAGMPAAIWEDFERRFAVRILEFYGSAEGGLTFNRIAGVRVGSIGRTVPSLRHRIVDAQGCDLPPDAHGERCGELLFQAADGSPAQVPYLHDPKASAAKSRDGWLWTGDIVREDAEGWLYFLHRQGLSLRRNGEFIDTAAITKVIADDVAVDDVYVYGMTAASGVAGEKDIVVAVVARAGHDLDIANLFARCRGALPRNACPTYIQTIAHIPKTASEKPREDALMAAFNSQPETVYREQTCCPTMEKHA